MLDTGEQEEAEAVIEQVESGEGDARAKLERPSVIATASRGPAMGADAAAGHAGWPQPRGGDGADPEKWLLR
ncbi:hypothetical protein [Streptomyces sp. WM6378]|uniref:hypothetical protein n=1 Tax=Streptomyces sp. WM6378 TaxID=1415557 RepID=UPI0006AE7CE4|nr:hypothetical protein [Streptomyces sp. WM6378]